MAKMKLTKNLKMKKKTNTKTKKENYKSGFLLNNLSRQNCLNY